MRLEIEIIPVAYPATTRKEQAERAKILAQELGSIKGVESAKPFERLAKAHEIQNSGGLLIVTVITASGPLVVEIVKGIFQLLRNKRNRKDHRETVINIHKNYFIRKRHA